MNLYTENRLQIRQNAIIGYTYTEYPKGASNRRTIQQRQLMKEARSKAYTGLLTTGAKKRLTKAIELLCQSIKPKRIYDPRRDKVINHRLSFITLTFHQDKIITAAEAYKTCLSPFLLWLRRSQKVNTYIWKVEAQKRRQIHYHITTTSYIPYQEIRDKWNHLQAAAGYLEDYHSKYGHYNPNSTDIHEVRHVKNLSGYLTKEYCKSIQNPNTTGKVWDCSLNLKKYGYYTITEKNANNQMISEIIDREPTRVKCNDFCFIIDTKGISQSDLLTLSDLHDYDIHLKNIRTYKRE